MEKQWQQNRKWTIIRKVSAGDARRRLWFSHALLATGYNEKELRVVTFGKEESMSWDFYEKYVDEAYAVFDEKFLTARKTPSRLKVKNIKEMLASKLKREGNPKPGKSRQ